MPLDLVLVFAHREHHHHPAFFSFCFKMEPKHTSKDMATETADASISGVDSNEIGAVESLGQVYSKTNGSTDDAILRAQGHKAAMPRLFSIVSTMGLMFWCVLGSICAIRVR